MPATPREKPIVPACGSCAPWCYSESPRSRLTARLCSGEEAGCRCRHRGADRGAGLQDIDSSRNRLQSKRAQAASTVSVETQERPNGVPALLLCLAARPAATLAALPLLVPLPQSLADDIVDELLAAVAD